MSKGVGMKVSNQSNAVSLWARLTEPHRSVEDISERRRARLLAGLLLVFAPLGLVIVVAYPLFDPTTTVTAPSLISVAVLFGMYGLSRSRYYQAAAVIVVVVTTISIVVPSLNSTNPQSSNSLNYLIFPLLLASMVLSGRRLLATIMLLLVIIMLVPVVSTVPINVAGSMTIMSVSSALLIIFINHRNALERDRQSEITSTNKKYDVALEGAKLGVWDWNLLTNDVIYSERWVNMLGYSLDDLAPRFETFASLVHPEDLDRVVGLVNNYLAGITADYSVEMRLKTKSGGYHWVLASGKVFDRTPDGKPTRLVGIHVDINERKTAEKERELLIRDLQTAKRMAEENSRLKSEFLSTMSHELRTPMNAIEGFSGIMLKRMGGVEYNDKTERFLHKVQSNSQRLLHLINDFLDLSRIESGRLELAYMPIDPVAMVKRWKDELSVLAENKGIAFEVSIDPNLPETIYGDEESLSKVAVNLLGNACKFTSEGKITLKLEQVNEQMAIQVTDTGIGIPPHAREFIFDEFRQVDQSSKRKYGGTGLGLAIVQKLTRSMGGTVTVESEVGKGSTFTVLIPIQTEPAETNKEVA